jgi:hypothetical protein
MSFSQTIGRWCAQNRWVENLVVSIAHRFPGSATIRACCEQAAEEILKADRAAVRVAFTGLKTYLSVPMDSEIGRQIYFFDHYQPDLSRQLDRYIKPGQTWIDANAGLGYFAMMIANGIGDGGKLFVFESSTEMNERLQSSTILNGATNVTVVPMSPGAPGQPGRVCVDEWIEQKKAKIDGLRITADSDDVFTGMQHTLASGTIKVIAAEMRFPPEQVLQMLARLNYELVGSRQEEMKSAGGKFILVHQSASVSNP